MKVILDAGGGRKMVVEDYGESDSKLVKVSIIESCDIFVVGTIPIGEIRRLGKSF
jgi:hypothetical protein